MPSDEEPPSQGFKARPELRKLSRNLVKQATEETVQEAALASDGAEGGDQESSDTGLESWNPDQVYQRALNWVGEEIQGQLLEGFLQNADQDSGTVDMHQFIEYLRVRGMNPLLDPRLKDFIDAVSTKPDTRYSYSNIRQHITRSEFKSIILNNPILLSAIKGEFVVEDFVNLVQTTDEIYEKCKELTDGSVTTYIPSLAQYEGDKWAMSLCTIDGQIHCCGDSDDLVTLQSVTKPLFYGICLDELGEETVHQKVGKEPSGHGFSKITLDRGNRAHNPLINTGAITLASMYKSEMPMSERFRSAISSYQALARGSKDGVNFNNTVYLSELDNGHRNYAIGYYLKSKGCLEGKVNLKETLELYFQMCSVETSVRTASIMAGALANGGRNVFTGEQVISERAVQNVLSIMFSCGMYDYSGEWAFEIGLPAKSGVSGLMILVIPDVMGVALWSPKLDSYGNSVRGVQFGRALVSRYSSQGSQNILHPFSNRRGSSAIMQNTFPPFPPHHGTDDIQVKPYSTLCRTVKPYSTLCRTVKSYSTLCRTVARGLRYMRR